jgi:OmpR family response regulator RpaB
MTEQKSILIAEDEKAIAKALQLKLEHEGYLVIVTNNGNEALESMKHNRFNLAILDLMMPELDGFGVLEEMKKTGDHTPTIVASNLSQDADVEKAKSLGVTDYYVKSNTSLAQIVENIKKIIG